MTNSNAANNLNQHLQQLVAEACSYPPRSLQRRQKLNEIVRVVTKSGKLWQENTPYYKDALQQTWLYFCRNPEKYDPKKCSVITWLDNSLKWRLQDCRKADAKDQSKKSVDLRLEGEETTNPINTLENPPHHSDRPLAVLEETREWVETDPTGELSSIHVKKRPDVTCQVLMQRRLPPEASWESIALEFNLPPSTAPNFYKRECLPRLRNFAINQGYLE